MKPLPTWFPFNPDAPRWLILVLAALIGAGVGVVGIAVRELARGAGLEWPGISAGAWTLLGVVLGAAMAQYSQSWQWNKQMELRHADEARTFREQNFREAQGALETLAILAMMVDQPPDPKEYVAVVARLRSVQYLLGDETLSPQLQAVGKGFLAVLGDKDDKSKYGALTASINEAGATIGRLIREEKAALVAHKGEGLTTGSRRPAAETQASEDESDGHAAVATKE